MGYLSTRATRRRTARAKIAHAGTFNANPLSAPRRRHAPTVADAKAIASRISSGKLRHGMNEILAREKVAWKITVSTATGRSTSRPTAAGATDRTSRRRRGLARLKRRTPAEPRAAPGPHPKPASTSTAPAPLVGTCHIDEIIAEASAGLRRRDPRDEGRGFVDPAHLRESSVRPVIHGSGTDPR